MRKHKNKLALTFLLLALCSFICISVGGEFLHGLIHYHKDEASHDQCFVSQLLIQVFTIQAAVILVLSFLLLERFKKTSQVSVFQVCYNLPYSQAPPISL
jgi:hypothetical protein